MFDEMGVANVGGEGKSSHNEYRLVTLILARHSPRLKQIRIIEPHLQSRINTTERLEFCIQAMLSTSSGIMVGPTQVEKV